MRTFVREGPFTPISDQQEVSTCATSLRLTRCLSDLARTGPIWAEQDCLIQLGPNSNQVRRKKNTVKNTWNFCTARFFLRPMLCGLSGRSQFGAICGYLGCEHATATHLLGVIVRGPVRSPMVIVLSDNSNLETDKRSREREREREREMSSFLSANNYLLWIEGCRCVWCVGVRAVRSVWTLCEVCVCVCVCGV